MKAQLTESQKYELLNIDIKALREEIKKDIVANEMYLIKLDELDVIQDAINKSIDLDIDTETLEENTRFSFYTLNGQVVVIRRKQFSVKLFFELLEHAVNFQAGNDIIRIWTVLSTLYKVFYNSLDEDASFVYSCLCKDYFINGKKYDNVEVFEGINKYVRQFLDENWTRDKINEALLQLEDLRVITFQNGWLEVNDKIYFD